MCVWRGVDLNAIATGINTLSTRLSWLCVVRVVVVVVSSMPVCIYIYGCNCTVLCVL